MLKLVKLLISNYRGISGDKDNPGVEVNLEDINLIFLIGKNNTGKSTILDAYEYFVTSSVKALEGDFHNQATRKTITIEAWLKPESEEDEEHSAVKKYIDPKTNIAKYKKEWTKIGEKATKYSYAIDSGWEEGGAGGFDTILQNAFPEPVWLKGLDSVEIILEKVQKMIKEKVLENAPNLDRFETIEKELEKLREDIIADDFSQKLESRLNTLMQDTFPELSVTLFGEEKDSFNKKLSSLITTDIKFANQGIPVNMENHGHGIRRQFLFNSLRGLNHVFAEVDKSKAKRDNEIIDNIDKRDNGNRKKMLLIEEPELFLHPQSIRAFADVLYELAEGSGFQVMAATHSPVLVDLSRDHTTLLRTVMDNEDGTKVHQVSDNLFDRDEKERLKMLNSFDPHVCEAFFNDKVILVEGDTEAVVFRELINKMISVEKLHIMDAPLIVNCGSKINMPSFQKVLNHFDIQYYVIHDLDNTYNDNGNKNAAWTLNYTIYDEIKKVKDKLKADRFIMEREFESAHDYDYDKNLGKPLSAYHLVNNWDIEDETKPAIKALQIFFGGEEERGTFDDQWVLDRKNEKIDIKMT